MMLLAEVKAEGMIGESNCGSSEALQVCVTLLSQCCLTSCCTELGLSHDSGL